MGTTPDHKIQWPLIAAGAVVSVLGLLLLADRIDHRQVIYPGQLWPLLLLAIAAVVVGGRKTRSELRKGLILLAVGIWFLVNTLEIGGLHYGESWPLLLILIGLAITFTPSSRRRLCCEAEGPVLVLWGALAWIAIHRVWGISWGTVWPLVIVAIGLSIVWRAVADQLMRRTTEGVGEDDAD